MRFPLGIIANFKPLLVSNLPGQPFVLCNESVGAIRWRDSTMQVNITLDPEQEESHELAEVLRAFAADYDSWMIRSIKRGRHTLHDEAGALIASLEIVKGAERERKLK
jgi:hypothetical protein